MAEEDATVFVVDDDGAMRSSLSWLLESVGLRVETFASAQDFLADYDPERTGCLLLDVRMPGMSGLDLQRELGRRRAHLPLIIITGHGDIGMAVRAMKAGAADFLEKPFNDQVVIDRVQRCIDEDRRRRSEQSACTEFRERLAALTPREHEVYERVLQGKPNRIIAEELSISGKTVEVHRARMMEKMQAESLAQLVSLSVACGVQAHTS